MAKQLQIELNGKTLTSEEVNALDMAGNGGGDGGSSIAKASALPSVAGIVPTEGQGRGIEASQRLMKKPGPGGLVLVGYAGVGKTTLIKCLGALFPGPVVVTPTGKAALRVTEATGLPAQTIHRWLYHVGEGPGGRLQFVVKGADRLLIPFNKLVIIDEASMLGLGPWTDLWRTAQRYGLKIILVGDGFQLPPVKERGSTEDFSTLAPKFADQYGFERIELTEILRQAADSPIIRASMGLRANQGVAAITANIQQITVKDVPEACANTFNAQGVIISHSNAARFKVNNGMRENFGLVLPTPGEPLMLLRNNYDLDVYNGEQLTFNGFLGAQETLFVEDKYINWQGQLAFATANIGGHHVIVCLEELSGKSGDVGGGALESAAKKWARANGLQAHGDYLPFLSANYGYCYTAHKAQGSEWPYGLVLLENSVRLREEEGRRWAYTALTRAKFDAAVYMGRI